MPLLTESERAEATLAGCAMAVLEKQGQSKFIENSLLLSVVTGIPIGLAWHVLDRDAQAASAKQKQLEAQTTLFRRTKRDLEDRLAVGGAAL